MMTIITKPSIGLTQFTDFTMKGSTAKTKFVKDIKYQEIIIQLKIIGRHYAMV